MHSLCNVIVIQIIIIQVTIMKFYDRINELQNLEKQYEQINNSAKMTVITGRRRIGKTLLSLKYCENKKFLYLFVSKKSESLLCEEFIEEIKDKYSIPVIGKIIKFRDVFELILRIAEKEAIVVIIDEFQEFSNINASVYSDIQNLWDRNKNKSHIHLIFIGSIYSLMVKIFQNSKEPLFGRSDGNLYLKTFQPQTLKDILDDEKCFSEENLFAHYIITGGVPRYEEILINNKAYTYKEIINFIFQKNSPFLNEGKNILIEEFGKEYGTYFSILELLAVGKTSRTEIESILEKNIGGYLERLINDYNIVNSNKPITAKPAGKIRKYYIKDNFINFWFRFIYKYNSAIETENFDYIKRIVNRDFKTYAGPYLEKLFHQLIANTKEYNIIGNYWERGNKNEIDIVALNEIDKKLLIGDVKLNPEKIRIELLKIKSSLLIKKYYDYDTTYIGLSIKDIKKYLK